MAQKYTVALPAQSAAGATVATEISEIGKFDNPAPYVQQAHLSLAAGAATVTANATNYVTFNLRVLRAGALISSPANGVIGSFSTTATSLVAETPVDFVMATPTQLQAGDILDIQQVQVAAGVTVPAGTLAEVEVE